MLRRLYIENIALIDSLELDFGEGFNVLTGETGAGKSIIIDAVNFVLGERASRELIKYGATKARVEAVFDAQGGSAAAHVLSEQGIECEEGEIILSRELTVAGKNTCRINGALVPTALVKRVSDALIDIHGQHEHQSLLSPANHTGFLDAYGHEAIRPKLDSLGKLCADYAKTRLERNAGFGTEAERCREMDMLSFQAEEIAKAQLSPGEDEALAADRLLLMNAERIKTALDEAHSCLCYEEGGNALSFIDGARKRLREISALSPEYEALFTRLEEAYYGLEDIAYSARDAKDALEFDPGKLERTEERLRIISDLKRKYGGTIPEILVYAENAQKRLEALRKSDERAAELDARLGAISREYAGVDAQLSELRESAAESLRARVLAHMADLGLDKADFQVAFTRAQESELKPEGMLSAEYLLTTNPGEPLKPLSKVASGGELSRIMLCFKAIFADNDQIGTLIFDEIDTGISGKVAAVVGEKMLAIAASHQVVCVTHLPQIAALADAHFVVEKKDDGERTTVGVKRLDEEGKYRRIAQMMDGDPDSKYAYEHAKVLIERAGKIKNAR
ncbi:MAG TPA: DNA repair protein RecN [Clostridia bacterium]|nr:DNA repair protein RecN [Clostridia bacterium]